MKKAIMSFIGAMMIVSLAACTPTTEKGKTGQVKETQAANGIADKQPDPNAPDLEIISVYRIGEDGKIVGTMDAIEKKTPQVLVDRLIEYGVLEEGTESLSFEEVGKVDEVGPGVVVIPGMNIDNSKGETGILNLNQAPSDELKIQAIANTFIENLNVINLTIQVEGETVKENLIYVVPGDETVAP